MGRLPAPRDFVLRSAALTALVSVPGVVLMALYLAALLRLPGEQWTAFVQVVALLFPLLCAAVVAVNRRLYRPILTYLAAARGGTAAARGVTEAAYRRASELPRLTFLLGEGWWTLGGVGVALSMHLREPNFDPFAGAVMVAAAASGGLVVMIFHSFLSKRQLAPVRLALAAELGNPALRERLAVRVGVREKLLVSGAGVTLVVVLFTLLLADALASRPLVAVGAAAERAFVGELAAAGVEPVALERAAARSRALVASAAAEERRARRGVSLGVLVLGVVLAAGVAGVVARDLVESTGAVARDVERVAGGDLREAVQFEGDDDLGTLGRAVEGMTAALRQTIGRVTGAADQVEGQAARLARVTGDLGEATSGQLDGIRQAARSMQAIGVQIGELTGSARSLSRSVDDSSSSVVELGAAGEQLHGTAGVLGEKVDVVSGSIERMAESVRRVVASAEDLQGAADATAGGLDQMASAMGGVGENAAETARLSEQVVEVAERGRERVQETISGMEAIRGASEHARAAIRDLGHRVEGIGAILGVIDDVAEETNLLALNAAIIAAQAGDQGRAFSVVADEIKELADRVLENTQEIGSVIRAVQAQSQGAARAMEEGAERVGRGVALAAEAGVALDEITRAARSSGDHIRGIVAAVREQADASGHIVRLMERVRQRVDQIRTAGVQHERGHEIVQRGSVAMREVATQLTVTTGEHVRGTTAIAASVERVRGAVAEIHRALEQQGRAAGEAAAFLDQVHAGTGSHEASARTLAEAAEGLVAEAHDLREASRRFVL